MCILLNGEEKTEKHHGKTGIVYTMNRYESFLNHTNGHVKKAKGNICEKDTVYIRTFKLNKGKTGKIFEITPPVSEAISIFGKNQATLVFDENPKEFNISVPYNIGIRCSDSGNRELHPETRMNFKIISKGGHISRGWRAVYGELSMVKKTDYSFPEGLYLSSDDILTLEALNPDIDIEKIEMNVKADILGYKG